MKKKWTFQEIDTYWNVWSFGIRKYDRGGWNMDELHIFFGPWCFVFLSSAQKNSDD